MQINYFRKFRHLLILSRWKRWIVPMLCSLPYLISLIWLIARDQSWIAQIMITPLIMGLSVACLGLFLAKLEFRE
jgi:hypothetical protein